MTDEPPNRSATPDDIESALRSMRAQILPDEPAAPPPKPVRRRRLRIGTILLVLAAGTLGAVIALLVAGTGSAHLRAEVTELSQRLAKIEEGQASGGSSVDDLTGRVARVETLVQRRLVRNAALAIVVSRLTAASEAGRPFVTELTALQQIAPEIDMSAFQPIAATGIPSVGQLAAEMAALAVNQGPETSALSRVLAAVFGPPETAGTSPYAEARRRAEAGDLAGAVQALRSLPLPFPPAVTRWLAAAEQRQTFDGALAALSASLLRDLTRPAP